MDSVAAWLALKEIKGIGNRLFLQLLDRFGPPEKILRASPYELRDVPAIGPALASQISRRTVPDTVKRELELVASNNCQVVTFLDSSYPTLLRRIPDPPPYLYVYGTLFPDHANIAVVGSRNATPYGKSTTERLCIALAARGITVVSGMARGIDTAAHEGALQGNGTTVAVLGSGLGTIYPAENRRLFHRIAKRGAVISEFPFHAPPDPHHFPIRNRIISGISVGTVIVEATQKSGSLITAKLAADQGREVFAVPGSVASFKSMGTHKLIKEGAKLVEQVDDILEELNLQPDVPRAEMGPSPISVPVTAEEKRILDELTPYPVHIDCVLRQVPLPPGKVSSLLLQLELKGLVQQSPGKLFARKDEI